MSMAAWLMPLRPWRKSTSSVDCTPNSDSNHRHCDGVCDGCGSGHAPQQDQTQVCLSALIVCVYVSSYLQCAQVTGATTPSSPEQHRRGRNHQDTLQHSLQQSRVCPSATSLIQCMSCCYFRDPQSYTVPLPTGLVLIRVRSQD